MLVLGLDTVGQWSSIGLFQQSPLGEIGCRRLPRQDDPLLPALNHLLDVTRVEKRHIELIAVALGPGSFTGLRVGLSLAKGLALGLKRPLVGVPSLPLYARRYTGWQGSVCALVSDRPDRAFVALKESGKILGPTYLLSAQELRQMLEAVAPPVLAVGPASAALRAQMQEIEGVQLAPLDLASGLLVAQAGLEVYQEKGADDLASVEPLYVTHPVLDSSSSVVMR